MDPTLNLVTYQQHLLTMAKYHKWATNRLIECLETVSSEGICSKRNIFGNSLLGLCAHLLFADFLWYMRVTKTSDVDGYSRASISTFWTHGADWSLALPNVMTARRLLLAQADRWVALLEGLASHATALGEALVYSSTSGEAHRKPLGLVLGHVFNHGTHHRGQISALLQVLDLVKADAYPVMDLTYFLDEQASQATQSRAHDDRA